MRVAHKTAVVFILLLLASQTLLAREHRMDSLMHLYDTASDAGLKAKVINSIALKHYDKGDMLVAMDWYLEGYQFSEEHQDSAAMYGFAASMGIVALGVMEYEEALRFLKLSREIQTSVPKESRYPLVVSVNFATVYEKLDQLDSADYYYQRAISIANESPGSSTSAVVYANYGNFLSEQKDPKGLEFDRKAWEMIQEMGQLNIETHIAAINIARDHLTFSKPEMALSIISELETDTTFAYYDYLLSELRSKAYEQLGDYEKALVNYRDFASKRDSIEDQEKEEFSDRIETYETERTQAELERLRLENELEKTENERREVMNIALIVIALLMLGFIIMLIVFLEKYKAQTNELAARNMELQIERQQLELKALLAQIKPHFIFNVLNSIQKFIAKNDRDSSFNYLGLFGTMMRSVLNHSNQSFVLLHDELETVNNYVEMEKLRFDKPLEFNIKVSEELNPYEVHIPPMLIQPFVENAIWHGLKPLEEGGKITVSIKEELEIITCEIEDTGIGYAPDQKSSAVGSNGSEAAPRGLTITRKRLEAIWSRIGKRQILEVINRESIDGGHGTLVRFQVPTDFFP